MFSALSLVAMAGWLGFLRQLLRSTLEKPIFVGFLGPDARDCDLDACVQMSQSPVQRFIGDCVASMLRLFDPYHAEPLHHLLHVHHRKTGRDFLLLQHPNDTIENLEVSRQARRALERRPAYSSREQAELVRNEQILPSEAEIQANMWQDEIEAEIDKHRRSHQSTTLSRFPAKALSLFVRHIFVSWLTLPFKALLARAVAKRCWNSSGALQRVSAARLVGPQAAMPPVLQFGALSERITGTLLGRVLVCSALEVALGMRYVLCEALVVAGIQKLSSLLKKHEKEYA